MEQFTQENKKALTDEMIELLEYYDYMPTRLGCETILDKWWEHNCTAIQALSKHPAYKQGKYMLVLDNSYTREINIDQIWSSILYFKTLFEDVKEKQIYFGNYEFDEMCRMIQGTEKKISMLSNPMCYKLTSGETKIDLPELEKRLQYIRAEMDKQMGYEYTEGSYRTYSYLCDFLNRLYEIIKYNVSENEFQPIVTERIKELYDDYLLEFDCPKVSEGQKITKMISNLLKHFNLFGNEENWNKQWALFGDAITPLEYKRITCISYNPIDYLRMSLGTSWNSCHTIDKGNKDGRDTRTNYQGMHCSGNISYMLDSSTLVYYTLPSEYKGNEWELQDKIKRQLFHIGTKENPCFVNGRLYPDDQGNSDGKTLYTQIRQQIEDILSTIWELPNNWGIRSYESYEDIATEGTHYPDYNEYSGYGKIKFTYNKEFIEDFRTLYVGCEPICIECGSYHDIDDQLSCCTTWSAKTTVCAECGEDIDIDDAIRIDGEYYCRDCCFYCDYHDEWELRGEHTMIENTGQTVCFGAVEYSGDFFEYDGIWYSKMEYEVVRTYDGKYFPTAEEAEFNDYYYTEDDGEYHHESELEYCEECNEYVLTQNYNYEKSMCNDCAKENEGVA